MTAEPTRVPPAEPDAGSRTDGNGRVDTRAVPTDPQPTPAPRRGLEADGRSLADLLKELSSEGADLVRQEVALAKAEMNEKVAVVQRNLVSMVVGGTFLLAALLFGLWTVNTGLTALLAEAVAVEVAVWLAPLLLTGALAAIGWSMIQKGRSTISDEGLTPDMTRRTIEEDTRWARRKAREVKEEIQHG